MDMLMSGIILIVFLIPTLIATLAIVFILNKIYPGGIIGAMGSVSGSKVALVSLGTDPENDTYYKLREDPTTPGIFTFVGI